MVSINVGKVEGKASDLLKKYSLSQDWIPSLPVPIENLIETVVGYNHCVENFGDPKILGAISPQEQLIYTNELAEPFFNMYQGSYQFTLAHEVGHWALHLDEQGRQKSMLNAEYAFVCREMKRKPLEEIEADRYAAALLLPSELVRRELEGKDYYSWRAIYQLAEQWKVSRTTLRIRLETLNMLYYCRTSRKIYRTQEESGGQLSLRLA